MIDRSKRRKAASVAARSNPEEMADVGWLLRNFLTLWSEENLCVVLEARGVLITFRDALTQAGCIAATPRPAMQYDESCNNIVVAGVEALLVLRAARDICDIGCRTVHHGSRIQVPANLPLGRRPLMEWHSGDEPPDGVGVRDGVLPLESVPVTLLCSGSQRPMEEERDNFVSVDGVRISRRERSGALSTDMNVC